MSSAADQLRAQIKDYVDEIYPDLDLCSYYQLLELQPGASALDIKKKFYEKAAVLHPDRHHGQLDAKLFEKLVVVYSRIAEGYRILSDTGRRAAYDKHLAEGKLRATVIEKEIERDPELDLQSPQARKFYKMAAEAMKGGDFKSADLYLGFALQAEPDSMML